MPTRREVLLTVISSPLAGILASQPPTHSPKLEIRGEPHCLSRESSQGFRLLLNNQQIVARSVPVIILPGARELSIETCSALVKEAAAGAWVVWEDGLCFSSREESLASNRILKQAFGFQVLPPIRVSDDQATESSYIEYSWPTRRLVRSFHAATPIRCPLSEVIAKFRGVPVCARRVIGRGGVVYLGSMLGPGLFAEEREAHLVGSVMLNRLR